MNELKPLSPVNQEAYAQIGSEQYREHLLEQYKLFVETTEHVSARRLTTNAFFLTLNSSVVGFMGYLLSAAQASLYRPIYFMLPLGGLFICFFWWALIRSHRQINKLKFEVIEEMEQRLPAAPFRREWELAGIGEDPRRYLEITNLEYATPWVYFLLYLGIISFHLF